MSSSSKSIAILGMHRSGTSTLAGTLRAAGVYLGDVLDNGFPLNPKGLQEPPSILYMHEDLLNKNGGFWHEPPPAIVWHRLHKAIRDLFIESRQSQPIWAFKDPRTLMTIEGWFEQLPDLQLAAIFRHPAEVAMSIHKRNEFDLSKCFNIWRIYNEKLLALHAQRDCPTVEFVGDNQAMVRSFENLLNALDIHPSEHVDFFSSQMRHNSTPDIDVPRECMELYERLRELAI